ncbi:hypothetical protein B7435_30060 [Mycolicibacterium peregrinum]|uniref:hypothetical protein n=1 Tax=Mycolicibacterium TaxID=1866885 RepID=UPI000B4A8BD9|nr:MULTISPECIES: hypothetical protein [Mycolicibacterium]MCV7003540.1 hypothetical protein [Mycolicibacterium alvei]OWL95534.1 hypothetical protein B7435_30060 [Mycolicibacterium peregrinum]
MTLSAAAADPASGGQTAVVLALALVGVVVVAIAVMRRVTRWVMRIPVLVIGAAVAAVLLPSLGDVLGSVGLPENPSGLINVLFGP